jgi:hypothetical protein
MEYRVKDGNSSSVKIYKVKERPSSNPEQIKEEAKVPNTDISIVIKKLLNIDISTAVKHLIKERNMAS